MIVWTGHGYFVAVLVFGMSLVMEFVTENIFQDENYYQQQAWPLAVALTIAGAISYFIGVRLNRRGERRLIDPETNEEVVLAGSSHTLFFIKMHWWAPILFAAAAAGFVYRA